MVKPIVMQECFPVNYSTNEAMKELITLIDQKKGVVIYRSGDYIKAKFGSMIFARLFGIFLLHVFKKTLPFRLEAKFYVEQEKLSINVSLSDNFGWAIRSRWGNSVYEAYFYEIMKEIKNSVTVEIP